MKNMLTLGTGLPPRCSLNPCSGIVREASFYIYCNTKNEYNDMEKGYET